MAFGAKGDLVFALKMSSKRDLKDFNIDHSDWLNLSLDRPNWRQALRNGWSHDSDTNLEKLRAKRSISNWEKETRWNFLSVVHCHLWQTLANHHHQLSSVFNKSSQECNFFLSPAFFLLFEITNRCFLKHARALRTGLKVIYQNKERIKQIKLDQFSLKNIKKCEYNFLNWMINW